MALNDLQSLDQDSNKSLALGHLSKDEMETRISVLRREHHELKEQIDQMERAIYLTPAERLECSRLKKLKLQKKDELYLLLERLPA